MTISTAKSGNPKTGKHRSRKKYPWDKWIKSPPTRPTKLVFGKDIPAEKKPTVLTTQLHQWGSALGYWVYTSVDHDKTYILVYGVRIVEGKTRPESKFSSPKKGTRHGAKSSS